MQVATLDDIKKSISTSVVIVFSVIFIICLVILIVMKFRLDERNNQFESQKIREAIVFYKDNLSRNLSILASSTEFLDYMRSGEETREVHSLNFFSQLNSFQASSVLGMEVFKATGSKIFSYGIKTPDWVTLKLCYLNQTLNSKLGACDYALRIFLSKKKVMASLSRNDNIIPCIGKTCNRFNFLSGKKFGEFDVKDSSNLSFGLEIKHQEDYAIYLYILIILCALSAMMYMSLKKFKTDVNKYLDEPLKHLAASLKEDSAILAKGSDINEIRYLYEEVANWKDKVKVITFKEQENSVKVGKLALQVAHDIRSPLAALNAIVKQTLHVPEQHRLMIRNATQQINDIANNLLVQYRTNSTATSTAKPEMISILLDSVISEKRAQYHSVPITLDFNVDANAYGVFANVNASDFRRVMSNLMNNAVEAMESQGQIILRLSKTIESVCIELIDNGVGMSAEFIEKVLKKGEVSSKKEGHGIGLYSSMKFVESWGGKLDIVSQPQKGTEIHISLPLIVPPDWFAAELKFQENSTIVILDDDQSIHDVWISRFTLEVPQGNFQLLHCYQPEDLLHNKICGLTSVHYLCDYELIGQQATGLDMIEKLNLKGIATLVTSRYDDPLIRERCKAINVKILPKNYAAYVPLQLLLSSEVLVEKPDLILIDDNKLLTEAWKMEAECQQKKILIFNAVAEAEQSIYNFDRDTCIYVDSALGEEIKGEEYAKKLYEQGFSNIYLSTGYSPSRFAGMYWLKGIVDKTPLFK